METTESDIGYPEEQPPSVDDTPEEGTPQRDGGSGAGRGDSAAGEDGKATGNPHDDQT